MTLIYSDNQFVRWAHSAWERFPGPPADLSAISDFLGLRFERDTLAPGIYGTYVRFEDGEALAIIEAALDPHEQRRVWAHEIGHHLLSKKTLGVIQVECCLANRDAALERECDLFAKHLLMPELLVREKAAEIGHPPTDRSGSLASAFDVEIGVMRARLIELGLNKRPIRQCSLQH